MIGVDKIQRFRLSQSFLEGASQRTPNWGFGVLSYITFKRSYARRLPDGNTEEWWQACQRVIEGMFTIQKAHCKQMKLRWDNRKAQKSAQEAFDRMFAFKWLPPGRGLWSMGTEFVYENFSDSLQNCGFCSTKDIDSDFSEPFVWLFTMSMYGVGIGFDMEGAGKVTIQEPRMSDDIHVVGDSREGWAAALERLLRAFVGLGSIPASWDTSNVRKEGSPIKGFGGVAAGPEPLEEMLRDLDALLRSYVGRLVDSTLITDIMNIEGRCVVAGGVRRTAEIALGQPDDSEFLKLKLDKEKLDSYRFASNNSVLARVGMDYEECASYTAINGEPGYAWLENMQKYGRIKDGVTWKDWRVLGGNPCQPAFATLLTPSGLRTFGDVSEGDQIWSETGWTTVTKKWSTGTKPVYEYRTTAGTFVGTENHRVMQHGEKIKAIHADSLDLLAGPDSLIASLDPRTVMDGLMLGDGTAHRARSLVSEYLIVGQDDQDYFQDPTIAPLFKRTHPANHTEGWIVDSTITAEELPPTYEREVPARFLHGDARTVCAFLRGLFSANGSICGKRITLKATSFQIIEQAQLMLSAVGIRSYYTTNKPSLVEHHNGTCESRESYDLNITTDRGRFLRCIGFLQKYKTTRLEELVGQTSAKTDARKTHDIATIEYLGDFEVFDITVDNPTHTYWTGGVNVSNCLEQSLEDRELCCLVENFPAHHESLEDFKRTLKYSYMYAKTVTLVPTHDERTNQVMMRNRRIGCSMSGIVQNIRRRGLRQHLDWCDAGYEYIAELDQVYSEWLCVPRSIKTTSVKPSGSVSLLAGATPGIHHAYAEYYIRRLRLANASPIWKHCENAGYVVEDCVYQPLTKVIEFPIHTPHFDLGVDDVSIWEQVDLAALHQYYWADNQVSCTVTFQPHEQEQIPRVLQAYEDRLKGISFLPAKEHGYSQPPYEKITREQYLEMVARIREVDLSMIDHEVDDKFCDGEACAVDFSVGSSGDESESTPFTVNFVNGGREEPE